MSLTGLFLDYESIYTSLSRSRVSPLSHEALVRCVVEEAKFIGEARLRIAWADWDRLPGAQRVLVHNKFDTRFVAADGPGGEPCLDVMHAQMLEVARQAPAPDVFVIAAVNGALVGAIDELKRLGRRTVVMGPEDGTSSELVEHADDVVFLSKGVSTRAPLFAGIDHTNAENPPRKGTQEESARTLADIRTALVELLEQRGLPWISYRLLVNHLVLRRITPLEDANRWIDEAVSAGYVIREEEQGAVRRFCKFTPGLMGEEQGSGSGAPRASHRMHDRAFKGSAIGRRVRGTDASSGPRAVRPRSGGTPWSQDWRNFTFVKMLWSLRTVLAGKPNHFYLNPTTLLEILRESKIVSSDQEMSFWINQAVDKGILARDTRASLARSEERFHRYFVNYQNELVTLAEEMPGAIVQTIRCALERRVEWRGIAFNFLLKLLQVHPFIAYPPREMSSVRSREWINFLISENILRKFEEPDLREPSRTTTMVALDPSHPQTQRFLGALNDSEFYDAEHQATLRAVLTIDHFLHWLWTKSPDEDWLPLMTLKSWLRDALGDQLAKWAISRCETDALFTVDRYQNKGGVETTVAGVRLERDHPLVHATLERRDEFVRLLIGLLRNRAAIPFKVIEEHIREQPAFGDTEDERVGWLTLMAHSKIIALDEESSRVGESEPVFICRLNAREKFVGELVQHVMRTDPRGIKRKESPSAAPGDGAAAAPEHLATDGEPPE